MQLTTPQGYDFFEAASAMQKEIRRGNEERAMYWALELGYRYPSYVWYRLCTIASEDIGPADNSIVLLISALRDNYILCAKKSARPGERIILAHAIIALCRAPKSRVADDLCVVVSHQIESEKVKLEIPDYALDFHTKRGRQMGRKIDDAGWDHWYDEGCKLTAEVPGLERLQKALPRPTQKIRPAKGKARCRCPRGQEKRARPHGDVRRG